MQITIISKDNCPYCTKALALAESLGAVINVLKLTSVVELQKIKGLEHTKTVPQVFVNGEHIGGYTEFESQFKPAKTTKTVFNVNNTGFDTGDYPLFLGDDLGFADTINRPYPILDELFQEQMAQIWNEFEVDITQDRQDMLNAPKPLVDCMVKTIMWQHLADSIASRSITGILLDHVSNSDLENWYNAVALFESIHARTYSHIIKQTFVDPNDALRQGYKDLEVIARSDVLRNAFDDLGNLPLDAPTEEKREKLYVALSALFMLEAVNFMSSFAITFGIAELGFFQGIAQDVVLIARDEILHARAGGEILKIEFKRNPEAYEKVKPKIQEVYDAILQQEEEWTDHLFSEGREIRGLSAQDVKNYVRFRSKRVADVLQLDAGNVPEKNPLPYMDRYLDSSKVQIAAQEMQLTSYLLNSVDMSDFNYDELAKELREGKHL